MAFIWLIMSCIRLLVAPLRAWGQRLLGLCLAVGLGAPLYADVEVQRLETSQSPWLLARQSCIVEAPFADPNQVDLRSCRHWGQPYLNLGDSQKPYWIAMRVQNPETWAQNLVLVLNFQLHDANFFLRDPLSQKFVEVVPPTDIRNGWISQQRFEIQGNETLDLLVFIQSDSYVFLPLALYTNHQFAQWLAWNYFKNALYYGALGFMFLFQLYLWLSLWERLFFYYLWTIPAAMALQLGLDGMILELPWPAWFNLYVYCSLAGWAVGVAACLFAREFLQLNQVQPWDQVIRWLLIGYSLMLPVSVALSPHWMSRLASASAFLLGVVLCGAGVSALRKGRPMAKIYLLGWGVYLASLCWFAVALWGRGDDNYAIDLIKLASLFELSVFALALASKMRHLQGETQKAQEALLAASRRQGAELEAKVEQRTHELAQANKDLDELLSIASHDLKTPLSAIIGYTSLLGDKHRSDLQTAEFLNHIRQGSETMLTLISNFLDLSRLGQGKPLPPLRELDLAELATDLVEEFQFLAHSKGMRLRLTGADSRLLVQGWQEEVRQVMSNLISNAIKYSPPGSQLEVRLQGGARPRVEVLDQGPGISAEDRPLLFGKFARLSNQPTAGESSNGLGLYIAYKLTQLMGGELSQHNLPHQGSCFQLEFVPAKA